MVDPPSVSINDHGRDSPCDRQRLATGLFMSRRPIRPGI